MLLFFDCETTGLPLRWNAAAEDIDNWPRAVQVAWAVFDVDGNPLDARTHLIKPEGFTIPADAVRIHGITTAKAKKDGVPIVDVLESLSASVRGSKVIIAHNLAFDQPVMAAEYVRANLAVPFSGKKRVCTMEETTEYCRLPGKYGRFKWPTLTELHRKLFGTAPESAHDAGADVATCARCFFELKKQGFW